MQEDFMRRAIALAMEPPSTSPNPRVGAVVVRDDEIVGEGCHRGVGSPHAETIALEAAGARARGATVFVTLEPCAHHGHTPPCAPALVQAGVIKVVAALEDPDPRVAGKGFDHLRRAGVEVEVGSMRLEAARINLAYLHQRRTGRPLVTLKLAVTLDGRLAAPDGSSRWITGAAARRHVHARRAEVDAVLVGAGTAVKDDPELNVRAVESARQPARVVVDAAGRVPPWARVFDEGTAIVATTASCSTEAQVAWKEAGAEVVVLPGERVVDLVALLDDFATREWVEVLCEGGGELATALLRADLVDRLELHHGAVLIGRGGPEIGDLGIASMQDGLVWDLISLERMDQDVLTVYERRRS